MGWPKPGLHTYRQGLRMFYGATRRHVTCWQGHAPYKLLDAESTSCKWTSRYIGCSIQIDMSVTNYAQTSEGVREGELRAIIKERGQIVGVRVEAHHLKLLCIDSKRLSLCTRS